MASFALPRPSSSRSVLYAFPYRIRITNEASEAREVIARHWMIADANSDVQSVPRWAKGVVGVAPRLRPGDTFEYMSYSELATARGTMHGAFQVVSGDLHVEVPVGPVALGMQFMLPDGYEAASV